MIARALDMEESHPRMTKRLLSPIPKEDDLENLNYWRPITLLIVMHKIFVKAMQLGLQSHVKEVTSSK